MQRFKNGDKVIITFEGSRHEPTEEDCGWDYTMTDENGRIGEVIDSRGGDTYMVRTDADSTNWIWHESALKKATTWRIKKLERDEKVQRG